MDVKPGYKWTEVGAIPEDWKVTPLGEIGEAVIGLTYKPTDVRRHGTLVLRSSNIQNEALAFDDNVYVEADIPERIRTQQGDVLICVRNGSRDLIGKSALLDERTNGMAFGAFMTVYRSKFGKLANYFFQSSILKRQINGHLGATINQITNKSLASFLIPYPSTKFERDHIAEALSDADGLLGGLDRLIVKKRDFKQAAMQQLLTGEIRLSGFRGKWTVKRLAQSCEKITKGTTPTSIGRSFSEAGVRFIKAESISESGEPLLSKIAYIDGKTNTYLKRSQLQDGDLLLSIAGVIGRVGRVSRDILPANTNQALAIIRLGPYSELDRNFLFHALRGQTTNKQISGVNVQAAQANISLKNVRELEINVPPARAEQVAIAAVLTEMVITHPYLLRRKLAALSAFKPGCRRSRRRDWRS